MTRSILGALLLFELVLLLPDFCLAAELPCENFAATGLDPTRFAAFHKELKEGLASANKEKVASLVHYPLKVIWPKKKTLVKNATTFVHRYDLLFKKPWIDKVLAATPANTICNAQGVGLSDGAIWISFASDDDSRNPKMITINL